MSLLRNINDLVKLIKKAAVEAVNASDPTTIRYGEVISTNPLQIRIDQKLILGTAQLKLTRNVTDYETEMNVNGGAKQTFKVFNALKVGEKVLLIRMQGGQTYIVVDRV